MTQGFGADARLSSRRDFQRVFTDGRKPVGRTILVWSIGSAAQGAARRGLSVSGKVGKAAATV